MSNGGQTSEQNNNERTVERMISKESMLTDYDSDEHDWSDYDGYYDNIDEVIVSLKTMYSGGGGGVINIIHVYTCPQTILCCRFF